jgi:hypothetical protein
MRLIILTSIYFLSTTAYSQLKSLNDFLILENVDSILFSIWEVQTKEMSSPGQIGEEYEKELARSILNKSDQELLLTHLKNPDSYDRSRALRHHYNLMFTIYKEGISSNKIFLSTLTGNIDVENKLGIIYFRNSCSEEFGKILIDFLTRYKYSGLFGELDLEGLNSNSEK